MILHHAKVMKKSLYRYIFEKISLPQRNFSRHAQVKRGSSNAQCLKDAAHYGNGDVSPATLQTTNLRPLYANALAKFVLCEVLSQTSFADSLSQVERVDLY